MPDIIDSIERDLNQDEEEQDSREALDEQLENDEMTAEEAGFLQGYHENFDE